MPKMQYESDGLRQGSVESTTASQSADSAASTLKSTSVSAGPFGDVNGAGAVAGAVGSARDRHAGAAGASATNLQTAAGRAGKTADLGDELDVTAARVAPRVEQANTVATGMQ